MRSETGLQNGVVLLADDDERFRESLATALRQGGYTCACAPDAATSRKLLQEMEIDLLIADINMPGNAELELVESIPQIAPGLPVILVTDDPTIETAARSVRLAVRAYLTKPLDLEDLFSLVEQSVSNYRRLRALRGSLKHLQAWTEELASFEENMGGAPGASPGDAMPNYLRITLRNLMVQLADLDRFLAASRRQPFLGDTRQLNLVAAIRRTIEVLEKTRHSFKSKELGELRRQLQSLVPREEPSADPKDGSSPG